MDALDIKPAVAALPLELIKPRERAPTLLAPVKAAAPPWRRKALRGFDGGALLRAMVAACLAQIRPNAEAIAHGSTDPEHVHQLRVGLRRLRSAAHGVGQVAESLPASWERAVRPVFDALGQARDRHVVDTALLPELRRAGAPELDPGGPAAHELVARLQALVRGEPFQNALFRLQAFADAGAPGRGESGDGLAQLVHQLAKLARQVAQAAKGWDDLPFEARHRARKRLKQLRYLAEFAAPAFDRDGVKRWLRAVEPAQDALGALIDQGLAARRFEVLAQDDARAWFAVGWLRARGVESSEAACRALERLRKAPPFW